MEHSSTNSDYHFPDSTQDLLSVTFEERGAHESNQKDYMTCGYEAHENDLTTNDQLKQKDSSFMVSSRASSSSSSTSSPSSFASLTPQERWNHVPGSELGPNDVVLGRGIGKNHKGNIKFRAFIRDHKKEYLEAPKNKKPRVAEDVVRLWRAMEPPGRFLTRKMVSKPETVNSRIAIVDLKTEIWMDVGDKRAREKASMSLRERTPEAVEFLNARQAENDRMMAERSYRAIARMNEEERGSPREPAVSMVSRRPPASLAMEEQEEEQEQGREEDTQATRIQQVAPPAIRTCAVSMYPGSCYHSRERVLPVGRQPQPLPMIFRDYSQSRGSSYGRQRDLSPTRPYGETIHHHYSHLSRPAPGPAPGSICPEMERQAALIRSLNKQVEEKNKLVHEKNHKVEEQKKIIQALQQQLESSKKKSRVPSVTPYPIVTANAPPTNNASGSSVLSPVPYSTETNESLGLEYGGILLECLNDDRENQPQGNCTPLQPRVDAGAAARSKDSTPSRHLQPLSSVNPWSSKWDHDSRTVEANGSNRSNAASSNKNKKKTSQEGLLLSPPTSTRLTHKDMSSSSKTSRRPILGPGQFLATRGVKRTQSGTLLETAVGSPVPSQPVGVHPGAPTNAAH